MRLKFTSRKELWKTIERLNADIDTLRESKELYLEQIRELEQRISLEQIRADEAVSKLAAMEKIQTTIKEKELPPCESELCTACVHCLESWANGVRVIIGCRKNIECEDYKAKPQTQYIPLPYPQPIPNYYSYPVSAHDALTSQLSTCRGI